jgi:predicted enzyme related to lactoylglutathione lyase
MIKDIRLGNVAIDCDDSLKLRDFYHNLLGWEKRIMFGCPAVQSKDGVLFLFMQRDYYAPPVRPEEYGKQQKQMHFDFSVPDVYAAVQYAESLGAVKAIPQFGGGADYVTMLDPAGHPFCLCSKDNTP